MIYKSKTLTNRNSKLADIMILIGIFTIKLKVFYIIIYKNVWRIPMHAFGGLHRPQTNTTEYYDLLGVDKNANEQEIKKAFRKKALKEHPDRGDAEKFKKYSKHMKYYLIKIRENITINLAKKV